MTGQVKRTVDESETGAVFTLGKSYLSENHQSYFFIKNDPIRKVITGDNQSAVICESGRLFVWGENQFGQLSAGSKEVISKPSCVKEIKNLGYKVRNIAFGGAFSVILTENSKVFFNGKDLFTLNETYGSKFRHLDNDAHCIIRHNYEIIDFHKRCLDDHGNLDDLVDIAAGRTHFVVLTNSGKLYCFGTFDAAKAKRQKQHNELRCISEHLVTRIAKCGRTFVVFVTNCNGIYLLGKVNGVEYSRVTKLNTSDLRDTTVYSIYVSQKDEIFLTSTSGDVYKSTNDADIRFERIILFNQNDNIRKFCSGNDFVCVLSDKNKFLTTFNEKAASAKNILAFRPPHELRKFQDLRIFDIAAGLHHILLFAVTKSTPSNSFDITSSDPNENIPIHTWPEIDNTSQHSFIELNRTGGDSFKLQTVPDFKNIISPRPLLAKETLQAIQSDVQTEKINENTTAITLIEEHIVSNNVSHLQTRALKSPEDIKPDKAFKQLENHVEYNEQIKVELERLESIKPSESAILQIESTVEVQTQNETVEKIESDKKIEKEILEDHRKSADKIQTMDMVTKSVSNIGDNLMTDIKSIATVGEEKLNDLAKETEKTIKEVPKNVIDYLKTSVGLEKEDDNVLKMDNVKESAAAKNMPKELTDPMLSHDMSNNPPNDNAQNESDKVKHNNKLNRALAEDDSNETIADPLKSDAADNEVKFINNGVDVSSTSNIIQAMNDEINEMSNDAKNKTDELTMKYDGIINDELNAANETASNKIFEVKNAGRDAMRHAATTANIMTKFIPLKHDVEEIDLEADGDTEQTTASIKSVSTPAKNQLEMDEPAGTMDTVQEVDATTPKESEGRVKRFFNEIKNNCKTADTVIEMEESAMQPIKSHSLNDIIGDNKTSKVCTIL